MNLLRRLSNNADKQSLANRLRLRRFNLFRGFMARVPAPWTILDVGGTGHFWEQMEFLPPPGSQIVVLNLERQDASFPPQIRYVSADARDMRMFRDHHVDVAFSNSVIEHVGVWDDQMAMAREERRVAKRD